jgi:hypothetical protein
MEDLLEDIGKELPPAEARETYETLAKVLGNMLNNPGEAKFRSLKKDNKVISGKILRSNNAASLLLAIGFEDDGVAYTCPPGSDLETIRSAHELLQCLILSAGDASPPDAKASAPPPAEVVKEDVAVACSTSAATKLAAAANPQGFVRRNEAEAKRQEQMDQLQAARAQQRAQYVENPQGPPPGNPMFAAQAQSPGGYPAAADDAPAAKKKTAGQSAFDFKDRSKVEQEKKAAEQNLQDIRKAQKDKFKDWQADPNAKQQEAYKQPPSVAAGAAKADDSWGGWIGGMFGGGSSSNGSSSSKPEKRGPNIKGVSDLPKPVRRG